MNTAHDMTNEFDDLISKAELCRRLDRSTRTINRWLKLDILPAPIRILRTLYWHWSTVLRHLDRYFGGSGPHRDQGLKPPPPPPPPPHKKRKPKAPGSGAPDNPKPTASSDAPADSNQKKQDGDDPAPPQEGGDNEEKP